VFTHAAPQQVRPETVLQVAELHDPADPPDPPDPLEPPEPCSPPLLGNPPVDPPPAPASLRESTDVVPPHPKKATQRTIDVAIAIGFCSVMMKALLLGWVERKWITALHVGAR
jgi:hypothetical protein